MDLVLEYARLCEEIAPDFIWNQRASALNKEMIHNNVFGTEVGRDGMRAASIRVEGKGIRSALHTSKGGCIWRSSNESMARVFGGSEAWEEQSDMSRMTMCSINTSNRKKSRFSTLFEENKLERKKNGEAENVEIFIENKNVKLTSRLSSQ